MRTEWIAVADEKEQYRASTGRQLRQKILTDGGQPGNYELFKVPKMVHGIFI